MRLCITVLLYMLLYGQNYQKIIPWNIDDYLHQFLLHVCELQSFWFDLYVHILFFNSFPSSNKRTRCVTTRYVSWKNFNLQFEPNRLRSNLGFSQT